MIRLAILMLFVLFAEISYSQNIWIGLHLNKDREYKTFKPKIIRELNTYQNDRKSFVNNSIKTLDQNGMLLSEERSDENGSKILKLEYFYDSKTKLKTSMIFQRWTRGYEKMIFIYNYTSNNYLSSIIQKDSTEKIIDRYEYDCNDQGDPIKVYLIDEKGNKILKESAIYFYDKNFASVSLFDTNTNVLMKDTIKINDENACKFALKREKYNSNCDIVSFSRFDTEGDGLFFEKEYLYDSYGNRAEEKSYSITNDSTGKKIKTLFETLKKEYVY